MMDEMIIRLSNLADIWAAWCGSSFVGSAVILLVVLTLSWAVGRNRSPQLFSLLFLLVLLKPFVPISFEVPASVSNRFPFSRESTPRVAMIPDVPEESITMPPEFVEPLVLGEFVDEAIESTEVQSANQTAFISEVEPTEANTLIRDLSIWVVPFLLYCMTLVVLMLRFAVNQCRFHRLVRDADEGCNVTLPIDIRAACARAGLRRVPRVVQMKTGSPAVWGIFKPTLILPRRLVDDLSVESLRWAVMHELAHLRRRDLVVHGIQRLLTLMQFWNPAAWIASSMMNRYREQACDDMALVWCDRQSVPAGEAFMHIVRSMNDQLKEQPMPVSLGVFNSQSKRACAGRLSRLLDSERPLREKMGTFAGLAALLAAVVLLPNLRAAVSAAPVAPQADADKDGESEIIAEPFVAAADVGTFELLIVGPKNEPVPGAEVEIRPKVDQSWTILAGQFKRNARYGVFTEADSQGRLRIEVPKDFNRQLNFSIKAAGYGPFWAQWRSGDQSEVLPAKYVAHLDAGQSVGGIIIDDEGKPVAGASVHPSIEYKKRETDESQLATGWSAKTDPQGRWRCDFVPAAYVSLSVEIVHPELVPTPMALALPTYQLKPDELPSQQIKINRGVSLTGKVTDQSGRPIDNANVRAVFVNETRSAKTDAEGNYRIPGCPTGSKAITVTAKTFAPGQKVVMIKPDLAPVNFQLEPGNRIRVRVVDKEGNPQNKARIFLRSWRHDNYGKGLGMVHAYTDENGVWQWNEAPADSFVVDVCPRGCITFDNQTLQAREQEYVFEAARQLVISGNVVDAETKRPIDSFRVIPGLIWPNATEPFWTRRESFDSRDGTFSRTEDRMDARHAVRIEADGYLPAESRFINVDEGSVQVDFELQPADSIQVRVARPDGSPAVGAEAAIGIVGAQIGIRNGQFSNTFARRVIVDKDGQFTFPPDLSPIRVVILDETGFADLAIQPELEQTDVTLTAWASVQGVIRRGDRPAPDTWLTLSPNQSSPSAAVIHVSWDDRTASDTDGNFRFDHVRPGEATIYQTITTHSTGQMSRGAVSHRIHLSTRPGEAKTLDIGGDGYAVVGRARVELAGDPKIDWEFSSLSIKPVVGQRPAVPFPRNLSETQKQNWYRKWSDTDAGKQFAALRAQHFARSIQSYGCKVDSEGNFRVDDVPAGEYTLALELDQPPAKNGYAMVQLGSVELPITIANDRDRRDPIDLGTIIVK